MKFFKRPVVAVILVLIVCIAATLLSFEVRFGNKCKEITDGFYESLYYNGELQPSSESRIRSIMEYTSEIEAILSANGEDTENLDEYLSSLENSLRYSRDYMDSIYYNYSDVIDELTGFKSRLSVMELNDESRARLTELFSAVKLEQEGLKTSGYNETVTEFLKKYDKFPVSYLYWHTNVIFPAYFG